MKKPLLFGLITLLILCMPILREQYNNGEFVTWYRPIVLFYDYLRDPRSLQPLFLMLAFSFFVYFIVSATLSLVFKLLKKR